MSVYVFVPPGARVCVAYACYLWIPQSWTHERRREEEVLLSALQYHQHRDGELESSSQFSLMLWLNIDVFTLNISGGFKVCPALIQHHTFFISRLLSLPSSSPSFFSPSLSLSLSLSLAHSHSFHSKMGILHVLTITLPPPQPPPSPSQSSLWPR